MNDIGYFDRDGIWISENQIGFTLWLEKHANKRAVLKPGDAYLMREDGTVTKTTIAKINELLEPLLKELEGYE